MQLGLLQSRLVASVVASCLLIGLYFALFTPRFALADEIPQALPLPLPPMVDHGEQIISDVEMRSPSDLTSYEPDFAAFDRSLIGRATMAAVTTVTNNAAQLMNVVSGTTQVFVFQLSSVSSREASEESGHELELRGRVHRGSQDEAAAAAVAAAEAAEPRASGHGGVERRAPARTVYISANTCIQPHSNNGSHTAPGPPQLVLYVSTSPSNQAPGPGQTSGTQMELPFDHGAAMYNFTTSSDVYFGVYAPNVTSPYNGTYNVEVAASVDDWYHTYNAQDDANLIWVDSDAQGALLMTHNLTMSNDPSLQSAIMDTIPFVMFASNENDWSASGLRYSYCGLQNYAQIQTTKNGKFASMVHTGMTTRGPGGLPKQQFYFSGLNSSSGYMGVLAMKGKNPGNGTLAGRAASVVGGGGHIFRATNFATKTATTSCIIIENLTFCDQVAYAVPANRTKFPNATALAKWYDSSAQAQFEFFDKSLQQVPCEAPPDQKYSLVRNCRDCAAAYKDWLCSVMIPRCEDFFNPAPYMQPRAILAPFSDGSTLDPVTLAGLGYRVDQMAFNASRNVLIDQWVTPGPYKEVLPCADLCYNLVKSCPASLGFACPTPGTIGFNSSYGLRQSTDQNADPTCNFPGSAHVFSAGGRTVVGLGMLGAAVALATAFSAI